MMLDFYNDFIESFNGKFQAACLNARWLVRFASANSTSSPRHAKTYFIAGLNGIYPTAN
jgi:hypothetical protein